PRGRSYLPRTSYASPAAALCWRRAHPREFPSAPPSSPPIFPCWLLLSAVRSLFVVPGTRLSLNSLVSCRSFPADKVAQCPSSNQSVPTRQSPGAISPDIHSQNLRGSSTSRNSARRASHHSDRAANPIAQTRRTSSQILGLNTNRRTRMETNPS